MSQLKEDLAGQEVDDEGHEEEEEPQEEAQTFQTHTPEEQQDRCVTNTRTQSDIHILWGHLIDTLSLAMYPNHQKLMPKPNLT